MTDPTDDGLPPPDAHLRAALRRAPDRDLQPPAPLSARILADARRAVAPLPWPQRLWDWLARPAPAGAFASLLLAGFIGLMWRDGPPPQAVTPPPVAQAPLADRQGSSREDAARAKAQIGSGPLGAAPVPVPPSADAQADARVERRAPGNLFGLSAAPTRPATAIHAEQAAAPAAAAPAPARPTAGSTRASQPVPLTRKEAGTDPAAGSVPGSSDQAAKMLQAPADPLAALLAAWRSEGPKGDATRKWLEDLRARTAGRWRYADAVEAADAVMLAGPGGEPFGRLHWEPAAVRWRATGDGRAWRAELSAANVERLRAAMPR